MMQKRKNCQINVLNSTKGDRLALAGNTDHSSITGKKLEYMSADAREGVYLTDEETEAQICPRSHNK